MENQINVGNVEGRKLLVKQVMAAFIAALKDANGTRIAFGANVMPRALWARCMALAMAEVGVLASGPDALLAVLDSELGNSSQLGTMLVKEGVIVREDAVAAGQSLADILAQKAEAKRAAQG